MKRNLLVIEIELGVLGNDENEDGNNKDINENEFEYGTQDKEVNLPSVTHCWKIVNMKYYNWLQLKKEVLDIELEKQK